MSYLFRDAETRIQRYSNTPGCHDAIVAEQMLNVMNITSPEEAYLGSSRQSKVLDTVAYATHGLTEIAECE